MPMTIHTASVDEAVKLDSQPKTVLAPLSSDMYARNMKALWNTTHKYGMPQREVFRKKEGARPSSASAYSDREPCSRPWLPADHAEVTTTALMMLGRARTPAFCAAMTNGDCAASPVDVSSRGSLDGTISPTTKSERM